MSKLFTFYNREVKDSALITAWSQLDGTYWLDWDGYLGQAYDIETIDLKIANGEYELVEDFRVAQNVTPVLTAQQIHDFAKEGFKITFGIQGSIFVEYENDYIQNGTHGWSSILEDRVRVTQVVDNVEDLFKYIEAVKVLLELKKLVTISKDVIEIVKGFA